MIDSDFLNINVVFLGDHAVGKSTLVGNLLYQYKGLPQDVHEKLKEKLGDDYEEDRRYALTMDEEEEEIKLKRTVNTNYKVVSIDFFNYVLIDTPGHKDHSVNMIGEVSKGDVAVIVVPSNLAEFKKSFNDYVIQRYFFLALAMTINKFIVVVNYRDTNYNNMDVLCFSMIKKIITRWVEENLPSVGKIPFIPLNALKDSDFFKVDPVFEPFVQTSFNQELGMIQQPRRVAKGATRIPISKVIEKNDEGVVFEGSIEYGRIEPGDELHFAVGDFTGKIVKLTQFGTPMKFAEAGHYVTITAEGIDIDKLKRGQMVSVAKKEQAQVSKGFEGRVVIVKSDKGIREGETVDIHFNTACIPCKIEKVQEKLVSLDNPKIKRRKVYLKTGESAIVNIVPSKDLVVERYADFPSCGTFAICQKNELVALGVVRKVDN